MGSGRPAIGLVALVGALAVVPSALLAAGVSRADASTCGSLSRTAGALAGGGELTGALHVCGSQTWAVGSNGAATVANRTLVERSNGSAWPVVTSPNQGSRNNSLNAVSMVPGAGWAAGFSQHGPYQPLALRWNGTQWSVASSGKFAHDALFTDGLTSFLVLNGQVPSTGLLLTPQPSSSHALPRAVSVNPGTAP